jgi:hypothetical protein
MDILWYEYVFVCVYTYTYISICTSICMHTPIHIYIYTYVCRCIYILNNDSADAYQHYSSKKEHGNDVYDEGNRFTI